MSVINELSIKILPEKTKIMWSVAVFQTSPKTTR